MFFEDDIDDSKYCGHLYGLGTNFVVGSTNSNSLATSKAVFLFNELVMKRMLNHRNGSMGQDRMLYLIAVLGCQSYF